MSKPPWKLPPAGDAVRCDVSNGYFVHLHCKSLLQEKISNKILLELTEKTV